MENSSSSSLKNTLKVHPHHECHKRLNNIMHPPLLQPEFLPSFSWFPHLYPDVWFQLYCGRFWGRGHLFVVYLCSMWNNRILTYHPGEGFQGLTKMPMKKRRYLRKVDTTEKQVEKMFWTLFIFSPGINDFLDTLWPKRITFIIHMLYLDVQTTNLQYNFNKKFLVWLKIFSW